MPELDLRRSALLSAVYFSKVFFPACIFPSVFFKEYFYIRGVSISIIIRALEKKKSSNCCCTEVVAQHKITAQTGNGTTKASDAPAFLFSWTPPHAAGRKSFVSFDLFLIP